MTGRDGFAQVLRAEWTKWRSVRTTRWCAFLAIGLTVLFSMLLALGSTTNANEGGPLLVDRFRFTHQPLRGDGEIVAHVVSQQDTGPEAKAGVLVKASTKAGSPYALMMVSPGHGARFAANFQTPSAGTVGPAPVWLKLTRAGSTVTGFESRDGVTWSQVGSAELTGLDETVELGLFATSPWTQIATVRRAGNTASGPLWTRSTATFDNVTVTGTTPAGGWTSEDIGEPITQVDDSPVPGSGTESGGTFTLTGVGDIANQGFGGDNDIVRDGLGGVLVGLIPIACLAVLFVTSEYNRGTIRTTFTASPRRVRVIVAKAIIVGGSSFVIGVVSGVIALYAARPIQRDNGFAAPAYPDPSLADGTVLRAVLGAGLFLAALALAAFGVGVLLRRTAAALTLVTAAVVLPSVLGPLLPLSVEDWMSRLTPAAGLAILQTRERFDNVYSPWAGFSVIAAYAVVALVAAALVVRRRDV